MAAPVPPGAPRQQPPTGPPNYQQNPNALADNFQNMNLNRPRGPPFGQPPPFSPAGSAAPMNRPGPFTPGGNPRPASGPPSATLPPNMAPGRPSGPPFGQAPPFGNRPPPPGAFPTTMAPSAGSPPYGGAPPPGARPSPVGSPSPMAMGPPGGAGGFMSNGPPAPGFQGGQQFPQSVGVQQQPPMGPPPAMGPPGRGPPQAGSMRPFMGSSGPGGLQGPPPSAMAQGPPTFGGPPQGMSTPVGSPFAPQMPAQPVSTYHISSCFILLSRGMPPMAGSMPPPRMYGMPPPMQNQMTAISPVIGQPGGPQTGASKIDPNQIPRPIPSSSVILHDTRQGNQANPPPPVTSDYIVRDTGNCSPRYMRCTINQIPCTADLLVTSGMQLALLVQPLALPHPSEEPIQLVDFGEGGPVRCSRCKGYINPFMKFIDQGRRFICNLCGFSDETPNDYHCNLGPDGRRRDADERPELCRGTVEFVATKEYMVREPMPAVYFFLIDVSMNAIQTGATAAACSSINKVIGDLPEGPRTMVGIATFDSTIHFYNLKRALQQPLMLIVPDVQDVYTPLETDVIVPATECRQHLELLLESIPTMFQNTRTAESAFGAAIKSLLKLLLLIIIQAAFLAMKILPSIGLGALSAREAEGRSNLSTGDKEAHKLLQPADKVLKDMAVEFAEYQVCVDVFITTKTYVDIASISVIPKVTGGQIYYYHPFSVVSDSVKLCNDLRWNVTRPQGFEAVMRVRCSQGIQVQDYHGNFCKRIPTDVDLPGVDCDKSIMVTLKHDDKLQDGAECAFQVCSFMTIICRFFICDPLLPHIYCSLSDIPITPPLLVREQVTNFCINILLAYRKFCATVSSSGQLILPEALKLLPLYTLALIKSAGLRIEGKVDERSFWISYVSSVSTPSAIPLVYPRMIAVHDLDTQDLNGSVLPSPLPLSSEHVSDDGIYLLENGQDCLIYVGNSVKPDVLQKLLGISSPDEATPQVCAEFVLEQYENPLSKKLNEVVNEIRAQRCSFLRLRLCKKGDASGMAFFSYLIEDKVPTGGLSYVEFLVHIHRQIQMKMNA
ncbi:Protein transport protein Sec24-like At4g32640 [Linum perenne]